MFLAQFGDLLWRKTSDLLVPQHQRDIGRACKVVSDAAEAHSVIMYTFFRSSVNPARKPA